jgi:hypothetical protein
MARKLLPLLCLPFFCASMIALPATAAEPAPPPHGAYKSFHVAVYVVVNATQALSDPAAFQRQFDRVMRQTHFDKVYVEVYRNHRFATDAQIEAVKKAFLARGVTVSGGVTLAAGGKNGQFGAFDYEDPADRAECERAVRLAAKHFDEVILDDFFFYTSKSDADIAAKGSRSWTQYRLDTMRTVARDLVLKPARETNPRVKMIVKYPNWYEHFQGLGYDLDQEAKAFDAIYTGTETRDPEITDQLLQQYESYEVFRYYSNVRPGGGNRGGWVDTFSTRYVDRYAEQLWDTAFAKAPEITLFSWAGMADERPLAPGDRAAWADKPTSLDWKAMMGGYRPSAAAGDPGPGWGQAAGYALGKVDAVAGQLGKPIGIASYKPYQSSGEDFLQNYLGNVGVPIEMTPVFPTEAPVVLLTEQAKADPDLVAKIKGQLTAGKTVVITTGLLRALQGKGIEDVVEARDTGRVVSVRDFVNGYGAGNGESLNDAQGSPPVLFPEVQFYTNDAWPIIRGVAADKGFPVLLMDRYSQGILYVLAIPENQGDLYNLPQGVITQIKTYVQQDFPVRIDAPARVSLFAYDNGTFVVESFRPGETAVGISVAGAHVRLRNLETGEVVGGQPEPRAPGRTGFQVNVQPHSFLAFKVEG